jgi:hypothetical protein
MSSHAPLAPSSGHQWGHCAGSIMAQDAFPDQQPTESTMEGDAAHWVASEMLDSWTHDAGGIKTGVDFLDEAAPNGITITSEIIDNVEVYVDNILKICSDLQIGSTRKVESRVYAKDIHPTDCWGTVDCWAYDAKNKVIYVWDFKYGHRYVDAYLNQQLIIYVNGIMNELGIDGVEDQLHTVVMSITQPRFYKASSIRTWTVKASDLRPHVNVLQGMAYEALSSDPRTTSGEHCRDCRARHACLSFQKSAMDSIQYVEQLDITGLTPIGISLELVALEKATNAIKYRKEAIEAMATQMMTSGKLVPGWSMNRVMTALQWSKTPKEVLIMGQMMGKELGKPVVPVTPNQAMKLGIDEAVIKRYSKRTHSSNKLTPVNPNQAKEAFGNDK